MNNDNLKLQNAAQYFQRGEFDLAIRVATDILTTFPRNFDALHLRALASFYKKDFIAALSDIKKAIAIRGDFAEALNTYGMILKANGSYDDALRQFKKAQEKKPNYKEAIYNIGNIHRDQNRPEEAIRYYDRAIQIDPRFVAALNNKGLALLELNNYSEAKKCFNSIISIMPNFAEAYYNRGNALAGLGNYQKSIESYDAALRLKPSFPACQCNRSNSLRHLKRYVDAIAGYDVALKQDPNFVEALISKSVALSELGQYDETIACLEKAIEINPRSGEAYNNLGNTLIKLGRLNDALESYEKAVVLSPLKSENYFNRANALKELKRSGEALTDYDRAISLQPDYTDAHINRGNVLREMDLLEDALTSYDRATTLRPDHIEAYVNRGNVLKALNRIDEAIASYNKAISLNPDDQSAKFNKSLLILQKGVFLEGFELLRSRWNTQDYVTEAPTTTVPLWDGSLSEGRLLLWAEQGVGDEVFYASMLSLLDTGRVSVSLSADARLHSIFARSFPKISLIDRKVTKTSIPTSFDAQAPIGNLGHILKVDHQRIVERKYPYLVTDECRTSMIKKSNEIGRGKRICGISWKSGNKSVGKQRSIDLYDWAPLWSLPNVEFVNLQYGEIDSELTTVKQRFDREVKVIHGVDVYNDVDGLLSVIDMCDVVFTIDNFTAHLAGSIGKIGVVLVPLGAGRYWYWGDEANSLWYPSLNLVHQEQLGQWKAAIDKGVKLLRKLICV